MSKKYKCSSCVLYCEMDSEREPKYCMVDGDKANWEEVKEEKTVEPKKVKLPDWCKVGEWAYSPCGCDPNKGTYFQVTRINEVSIFEENDVCYVDDAVRARLRPYNADEMKALVGKALKTSDGDLQLITAYYNDLKRVLVGGLVDRSADEIKERYINLDGSPCGVLEHLNEKGEWVK